MSKIQILFASVLVMIITLIVSCFVYTEEIRKLISNKYNLIISFLVLMIIINVYYSEFSNRDLEQKKDLKYFGSFSISLFTIAGIVFTMHIILFVVEWIEHLFK